MSSLYKTQPIVRVLLRTQIRQMSASARFNAEGSTGSGASRPGGQASGDAFTKREKANEDFYVKEQEKAKLRALQKKIEEQKAHLAELEGHVNELQNGKKK